MLRRCAPAVRRAAGLRRGAARATPRDALAPRLATVTGPLPAPTQRSVSSTSPTRQGKKEGEEWIRYHDKNGREYFYDAVSGTVTWTAPDTSQPGVTVVEAPAAEPPAPTSDVRDGDRKPPEMFLGGWSSDGLPHLPDEPAKPELPAGAPMWQRALVRTHHTMVYSRKASLAAGAVVALFLAVWAYRESVKEAEVKVAQEERKKLKEQKYKR